MILIPDDPIIRSMERTGYPPWWREPDIPDYRFDEFGDLIEDDEFFDDYDEIFYGNDSTDF
jgi:hypothetical protein